MGLFGFGTTREVARTVKVVRQDGPAVSLDKVEKEGSVDLRKKTEAAGNALKALGMDGVRAQVVLLLDYSGSMHGDYGNGNVQKLVERFLAFGLQVDADGEIPIIPFATNRLKTINVNLGNYKTAIQDELVSKNYMGSTNLTAALEELRYIASKTDAPIFCGIVTDGSPDSQSSATKLVCDLANYPVFLKFLALYDVPYLQNLDDLDDSHRLLDNVDTKSFPHLNQTDEQFAEMMADEWDSWMVAALAKGVLTQ